MNSTFISEAANIFLPLNQSKQPLFLKKSSFPLILNYQLEMANAENKMIIEKPWKGDRKYGKRTMDG